MSHFTPRLAVGLVAAAGISLTAYRLATLTRSGAVAATVVGGAVLAGTGLHGSGALLAYFASSSALGMLPGQAMPEQRRGSTRDAVQVVANGGVSAILAILSAVGPEHVRPLYRAGFAGSLAAATADTWATEIGSRTGRTTRSIVTLQQVPRGSSGGVTLPGLLASAAGALSIAAVVGADSIPGARTPRPMLPIALGGLSGSLADSFLGATVQELYLCDSCLRQTEQAACCGQPTRRVRGIAGIDNDVVNALAITFGAAVTVVASLLQDATGRVSRTTRPSV